MGLWKNPKRSPLAATLLVGALAAAGCQPAATNTNTAATTNAAANANAAAGANANTSAAGGGAAIETREPDRYSATMVVSGVASGQQQAQAQTEFKVARNGADRRYSLDTKVPMIGEIIFLDKADKRYIIMPARKQFAELTAEGAGFGNWRSMTPGQMVGYVERQQGVTRVGEESLNGRPAVKYRYAGRAATGTQAGDVASESFIWVDTQTGLPLRVEGVGQSTGNVQGVSGGRYVVETRNITTEVDPTLFEVPAGYSKITEEQLKQGANAVMTIIQGLMGAAGGMQQQQGGGGATTATPATAPSPSGTR